MIALIRLIYALFNIYALGLVIYIVLSWIRGPFPGQARARLEPFYRPFLDGLRKAVGPLRVGGQMLDLSTAILLMAILLVRDLIVSLLRVPF